MERSTTVFIGLGSNLGDRQRNILNAIAQLNTKQGLSVSRCSSIYTSKPLSADSQPQYLNCVVEVEAAIEPLPLLGELKDIEKQLGRTEGEKWQSRVIDLDIIFYGSEIFKSDDLQIPHSQAHLRSFVLDGMCELEPEKKHPVIGLSCRDLKAILGGGSFFIDKSKPILIELTGPIGVGKTTLAEAISGYFDADILREKYDENPFLPLVYEGREDLSLKCELFFLDNSVSELKKDKLTAGKVYIADYIFEKSTIYPRLWLNKPDFDIFMGKYLEAKKLVQPPAVVLDVFDTAANCLDRIHLRSRKYEQDIKPEFIEKLSKEYEQMLDNWSISPVIRIDAAKYDFTDKADITQIYEIVRHYIGF